MGSPTLHAVKAARKLLACGLSRHTMASLDAPVGTDPDAPVLGDVLAGSLAVEPTQEAELLRAERRRLAVRGWRELGAREREILARRFGRDETLEEIGARLSLSRERVRQIERAGLARLRSVLGAATEPAP